MFTYSFFFFRDTPEKVPWATLLLHQFRFLDTLVCIDILTANIEQLLETCPVWFQQELILFLPDMLSDTQHQSITDVLTKMLEENCELANVILNCIASFNLGKEYLEEYKLKVLHLLKTNIKIEYIPAVIRYIYILNFIYYSLHHDNFFNGITDLFLMTARLLILLSKCFLYYATWRCSLLPETKLKIVMRTKCR